MFKGAFLVLRQFLATESPLKMIKNAFCFTLKVLFVLKIFKFKLNFKFHDATTWETNNCATHIAQYLKN